MSVGQKWRNVSCNPKVPSYKSTVFTGTAVLIMLPEIVTLPEQHFSTNKLLSYHNSWTHRWEWSYVTLG